jgi:8-oxo-dGTP pyrophosphatase MutT (NUDIX family)
LDRTLFRIRSAFSRPKVKARLADGIIPFAQRFHSSGAPEAVVLTLYKKSAANPTASSVVPCKDDFVLLAKKKTGAKFLSGQFALIGGVVEKADLVNADCGLDVYRNALAREAFEEAGLTPSDYASSYCSSFFDRATKFRVHCFSGFLLSDPEKTVRAQHLAHANLRPTNSEHDSFSWVPVRRVFSSRQVSKIAKRAVDLTLSD